MALRTQDILVKARELISEEDHWIQEYIGLNEEGLPVLDEDELRDATCFCSLGACLRAVQVIQGDDSIEHIPEENYEKLNALVLRFHPDLKGEAISVYNDNHSHKEVLDLFDAMIAEA